MGVKKRSTIEDLRKRYHGLANAEKSIDNYYTTSDERISLASALYMIDDQPENRVKYEQEVNQWLQPPSSNLSGLELETYWKHRWTAVNSVEYMRGDKDAISLLESMLTEKPRESWVEVHVPRALQSLRGSSDKNSRN